MADTHFRPLTKAEETEFRTWARENYVPGNVVDTALWHPIIIAECYQMVAEQYIVDDIGSDTDVDSKID